MFFRHSDLLEGALSHEKAARAADVGERLQNSLILNIKRKFVTLDIGLGEPLTADVGPGGITVYLGGFDWVTYPTPQHILQNFPEYLPLPQQVFRSTDDEL